MWGFAADSSCIKGVTSESGKENFVISKRHAELGPLLPIGDTFDLTGYANLDYAGFLEDIKSPQKRHTSWDQL